MGSLFKRGSLFKTGILGRVADALEPDRVLMEIMNGFIEATAVKRALDVDQESWKPGQPLKLLLAGYVGTRNTGADVRVEEMIRQFRHLLGDELAELSILTIDPALTRGYFRTVRQLTLPKVFPKFITEVVHDQHGVIACEGSMFKSKFANALSTLMVGALGGPVMAQDDDDADEDDEGSAYNRPTPPTTLPEDADSLESYLEDIEKNVIVEALESTKWNKTAAAKKLGITFRALRYRLKKLGLE